MKKVFLATTAIISGVTLANNAHALSYTATASVETRTALGMSQSQAMNFGVAEVSGSNVVIHLNDNNSGSNTTATMIDDSAMADGLYSITGSSTATISISASDAGNASGFEFTELNCKYNGGSAVQLIGSSSTNITSGTAPGGAGRTLDCDDVELTVTGGTSAGTYSPQISFTVNYE